MLANKIRSLSLANEFRQVAEVQDVVSGSTPLDLTGASFRNGDLGVLWNYARQGGGPAPSSNTPSGWETPSNNSGGFSRMHICIKILDGTETNVLALTASTNRRIFAAFRFPFELVTLHTAGWGGQITNSNPSSQTINVGASGYPCMFIGHMGSQNGTLSSRSWSETVNEIYNTDDGQAAHWNYYESGAPSSLNYDLDDDGNENGLQSFRLYFNA